MPTKTLPDVELNKILLAPNIHKIRRKLFNFVVFDIETTGLDKQNDEIIQISAVKFIKDKKVDTFDSFISLSRHSSLPLKITMLTGIHDEDLDGAPNISNVLNRFDKFIQNLPLVGHNIERFDIPFLLNNGFYRQDIEALDTLRIARSKNIDVPNLKLPTLKNYFGIKNKSHNALEDCITNAIVYQRLRDNKLEKVEFDSSNIEQNIKGVRIAITGEFEGIARNDIINEIKMRGGRYTTTVSHLTNYLLQGTQVANNLSADGLSTKQKKANELIEQGTNLKIISLDEFNEIIK
jgi:DNA polymerase-3 subunit epsilon